MTLIGKVFDPPTNNRPFADKRDKVGTDGIPKDLFNKIKGKDRKYI